MQGQDGRTYPILIPCVIYGKKAEVAAELEGGQLALFEGKLAKRKKDDGCELLVTGYEVTAVQPPASVLAGTPA